MAKPQLSARVDSEVAEQVRALATAEGLSTSAWIHRALRRRIALTSDAPIPWAGRNVLSAEEMLGELQPGETRVGMSHGRWDLVDGIRAILDQQPPEVEVTLASWTASDDHFGRLWSWYEEGHYRRLRFVADMSFRMRNPAVWETVLARLGEANLRIGQCHAKFVAFHGPADQVPLPTILVTSANLNRNKRIESWWVTTQPAVVAEFVSLADDLWRIQDTDIHRDGGGTAKSRRDTKMLMGEAAPRVGSRLALGKAGAQARVNAWEDWARSVLGEGPDYTMILSGPAAAMRTAAKGLDKSGGVNAGILKEFTTLLVKTTAQVHDLAHGGKTPAKPEPEKPKSNLAILKNYANRA